jgi:hypothetical protein
MRLHGKTRLLHVSKKHLKTVATWRKNYDRLVSLIDALTVALLTELKDSTRK